MTSFKHCMRDYFPILSSLNEIDGCICNMYLILNLKRIQIGFLNQFFALRNLKYNANGFSEILYHKKRFSFLLVIFL